MKTKIEVKAKELSNSISAATNSGLDCTAWLIKFAQDYLEQEIQSAIEERLPSENDRLIIINYKKYRFETDKEEAFYIKGFNDVINHIKTKQ